MNFIKITVFILYVFALLGCSSGGGSDGGTTVNPGTYYQRRININLKDFSQNGNTAATVQYPDGFSTECYFNNCAGGVSSVNFPTGILELKIKSGNDTYSVPIEINHADGPSSLYILVDTNNSSLSSYTEAFIDVEEFSNSSSTCSDAFVQKPESIDQIKLVATPYTCRFNLGLLRNGSPLSGHAIRWINNKTGDQQFTTDENGEFSRLDVSSTSGRFTPYFFDLNLPEGRRDNLAETAGSLFVSVN